MAEDPEAERVAELLARVTRGELSEAEAEELELYAADSPELRATIAARTRQASLGGGWLARVEVDHQVTALERSPTVRLERTLGVGLVALGLLGAVLAPLYAAGALGLGLLVLLVSWLRVNHHRDPYKDIQR